MEPYAGRTVGVVGEKVVVAGESAAQVKAKLKHLRRTGVEIVDVPAYQRWKRDQPV